MSEENILDSLMDKKLLKILKAFIDNPGNEYYLRELAKKTRIPVTSTLRIVRQLVKLGIVDEMRIKQIKLYKLRKGKQSEFLSEVISTKRTAMDAFIDLVSQIRGVEQVLLHGKETPEKASVMIIGREISAEKVQYAVLDVKQRFKYNIIHLILGPEQFEQMTAMGLYPGQKVVLFRREE